MITSPRQRRQSPFAKLLSWSGALERLDGKTPVCSESQFRIEMEKERSRVDRRATSCTFALILMNGVSNSHDVAESELLREMRERLRITDCLGRCGKQLGALLPETDREGAFIVAAQLEKIASNHGVKLETDVFVYPDDDDLAQSSIEFETVRVYRDNQNDDEDFLSTQNSAMNTIVETRGNNLDGVPPSLFSIAPPTPIWKRAIDIASSALGLIILSPVLLISAIAIRLTSPGPIFFRQLREGKGGQPFYIYKFRTMCHDAENLQDRLRGFNQQDGPAFKIVSDPRLTTIGKYLRKSCVDELPQLLNILKGEMSLVGPRPLPVNESLGCMIWQRRRLEVVPGLTCIWQVRGNHTTKFADWMRMDMEYIRRRSFLFDIRLIFETVYVVLLHRGSV